MVSLRAGRARALRPASPQGGPGRPVLGLLPYARAGSASKVRKRTRLKAAQVKLNRAATLAVPRWRSLRRPPIVFIQPQEACAKHVRRLGEGGAPARQISLDRVAEGQGVDPLPFRLLPFP